MDEFRRERAALLLIAIAAVVYSFTGLAGLPLHRPLWADLAVTALSVRMVWDNRWMRRHFYLCCWIVLLALAVAVQRWDMAHEGLRAGPGVDGRVLAWATVAALVVLGSYVAPAREALWRMGDTGARWLVATSGGVLLALVELAGRRGDGPTALNLAGHRLGVASVLAAALLAFLAPRLGAAGLALCGALAGLWIAAEHVAPLPSFVVAGGAGFVLTAALCRERSDRIAVGQTIHTVWSATAALVSVAAVAGALL